jgi:hypothetical protein
VKVVLYREKHQSIYSWKHVNTAGYRKRRILAYGLGEIEAWLQDRHLHLNMENVRHKDAEGHWIVTTFWAELTVEQQIELKLTLGI